MSRQRKWLRRGRRAAIAAALLALAAIAVARIWFHGERLASLVTDRINARIRGRVAVRTIEWPLADAPRLLVGGWVRLTLRDVTVYDASGDPVVTAPELSTRMRLRDFALRRDYVFRDIRAPRGGWVLLREEPQPYPTSPDDTTVVSLIGAFYSNRPPAPPGSAEDLARSSTWDLRDFAVDGVDVEFDFPSFRARADDATTTGWLYYAKPEGPHDEQARFSYRLTDLRAPRGALAIAGAPSIALEDVRVATLAKDDPAVPRYDDRSRDLVWSATARAAEGAELTVTGGLEDYWLSADGGRYAVDVHIDRAAGLAAALTGGAIAGEDLRARIEITGPRAAADVRATVEHARAVVRPSAAGPPLDIAIPTATATYRRADRAGELVDARAELAGGSVHLAGDYALDPTAAFRARVTIDRPLQLQPWIARSTARLTAGTMLSGRLAARSIPGGVRFDPVALHLGAVRARGAVELAGGKVRADGLRIARGATWVASRRATVDLATRAVDLGLSFASDDLRAWLRRLGHPPIAARAHGTARIAGPLTAPAVPAAAVTLGGIPYIGSATVAWSYRDGRIVIDRADARPFGGRLTARGAVSLRGRRVRLENVRLSGQGLELRRIPGLSESVSGVAHVYATASGPIAAPVSTFGAGVDDLVLAGDAYDHFTVDGATAADGSLSVQLHVDRRLGGRVDIDAAVGAHRELTGALSLRDIPLHSLPMLAGAGGRARIGGLADADLRLGGTVAVPVVTGALSLDRVWFKDAFLGAADLRLTEAGQGEMRVSGSLFQDTLTVDGVLHTAPEPRAELDVAFRRIELDRFFPEWSRRYGVRGWMTGRFEHLVVAPGRPPEFALHLSELVLVMDDEDPHGRPRPIRARAVSAVDIRYDGHTAQLVEPAVFRGPTGDFTVTGRIDGDRVDAHVAGAIDVGLLQPYLRDVFERAQGVARASIDVVGPVAAPSVTGILELEGIAVRPLGQDAEIRIPMAKLQVTNRSVIFTGFTIEVDDDVTGETDVLEVRGAVGMDDFEPRTWGLRLEGRVAGKLLNVAAPDAFTAASGSAGIEIDLYGTGRMPNISGRLTFGGDNPLTFTPRGLRREVLLSRGEIDFDDQVVEFVSLGGTIDDAGQLLDLSGELSLDDWRPADVDITLAAEGLPFRIPRILELEVDVRNFRILGDRDRLEIYGQLDIIDGRYIQKFNPLLTALKPERVQETEPPFYEAIPLLADAQIDLRVTTGGGFAIKNNVADIDLDGEIEITGTPSRPRLDGEIRVQQGSFKFQGMRTRFDRTEGAILFSRFKQFPDDNPTIDIRSEATYLDARGTEHDVVLTLEGTLANLNWDLYTTNTGLNKSQTLTLLFAGRTTEETRSLFGDEPIAGNENFEGSRTTARTEGLGAFDQVAKDYLGDFISALVEEPLRNATGLDVVRLEVGTAGVGGRVEERIGNKARALTEFERTLQGYTFSAQVEYQLSDRWSLAYEYLLKQFFDDTDEDFRGHRVKAGVKGRVGE
ncbi:MAG: hypothetical protein D6689_07085 [Deltaproteobacteria bacterium]|nr:MAG: hypothetical protein D6689_07085 [Deltaproteobacteria bacterium]